MASSTDSQPTVVELITKTNELLEKVQSTTADVARCCQLAAAKTSHIELRQCASTGGGTDASRFADEWARAKSAHLHECQWVELVERVLEFGKIEAVSYQFLLAQKDQRRAEGIVEFFWLSIERGASGKTKFDEPNYKEIAEFLPFMPSSRRKMLAVADKLGKKQEFEKLLPPVPEGLSSLFKIVVPMGTNYDPILPIPEMSTEEFEQQYGRIPGKHKGYLDLCLHSTLL